MDTPSDLFPRILYGGFLRSVSSYFICGPFRPVSLQLYGGPPQVDFFAYYMGPHVSFLLYYMGAPSGQFLRLLYEGPTQVSFFVYYMPPLRSVSSHTIWGPPQINFFVYYRGPSDQLLRILYGAPQISFFAYCLGAPSGQFLRLL